MNGNLWEFAFDGSRLTNPPEMVKGKFSANPGLEPIRASCPFTAGPLKGETVNGNSS